MARLTPRTTFTLSSPSRHSMSPSLPSLSLARLAIEQKAEERTKKEPDRQREDDDDRRGGNSGQARSRLGLAKRERAEGSLSSLGKARMMQGLDGRQGRGAAGFLGGRIAHAYIHVGPPKPSQVLNC